MTALNPAQPATALARNDGRKQLTEPQARVRLQILSRASQISCLVAQVPLIRRESISVRRVAEEKRLEIEKKL